MKAKPTKGKPVVVAEGQNRYLVMGSKSICATAEGSPEDKANAELIKEAFNTYNATNKAPKELQEENSELAKKIATHRIVLAKMTVSGVDLQAQNDKMREALEGAMRIKDLWAPSYSKENIKESEISELAALSMMRQNIEKALTTKSKS